MDGQNLEKLQKQTTELISTYTLDGVSRNEVIGQMLRILAGELIKSDHNSSDEVTTFLSKREKPEVLSRYSSPQKRFGKASPKTPTLDLFEVEKMETISDLKSFRRETKSQYERMQRRSNTGYFETNNKVEKQIIKAHSLSASIVDRFPVDGRRDANCTPAAERMISAIKHVAEKMTGSEVRCLEELNKKQEHKFTRNTSTFTCGELSGTPDAISRQGDIVVDVAEFKEVMTDSKDKNAFKNQKNAAVRQLQIYMKILGLEGGWICIDDKGTIKPQKVPIDEELDKKLLKRLEKFKEMADFIDK